MTTPVSNDSGQGPTEAQGRVLLVDDQPALLEMLAEALQQAGFSVATATNGREALARLQSNELDVVVADVEMPEMDGYELCRRVRAAGHADIPFLFCSGLGEPDHRLEGLQAGADDYIVKPADLDELILKLNRQVGRVRRLRAAGAGSAPPVDAVALAAMETRLLRHPGEVARLGRFEVRGILGRGSMGTVFRAWDLTLERWVAIKTVRAAAGMASFWDESLVRRLVVEAAMVARFNHPHVVTVHDVQEAADAAYLVMELVEGTSLQELLRSGARLGAEHAVPLMAALASALSAAHAIDLVHRDVKPHNVLLGHDGAIKLTDFGIASFVSSQIRNALFGTPGYLPPEAIRGTAGGGVGDLFALGAVAYRCLAGRPAFEGSTAKEVLWNTMNSRPPRLLDIGIDVPSEVDAIVAGLLEPNPHRRIGDAMLLAAELERLTALWRWRWTMPPASLIRSAGESATAPTDVPHAQVVSRLADETRPPE
jgi:eukaryotic-like serine/threonine-protein kinase